MQRLINHHVIEIVRGDIADEDSVAIVNAANNHLWMGGGVAGAIKRRGGEEIEREAVALGPIEVGSAVVTSGNRLKAKFVIHAAVMGQDLHANADTIARATSSALQLAEHHRISSISFPALGTGVGGFSIFHCASIMITEAISFLQTSGEVQLVRFVLFDGETFQAFEQELKLQFSSKRH